jgi:hypothetical protein
VFVVHDTKLVDLYPVSNEEAITIARCAFLFITTYGKFRGFATDPGSCFTSAVVAQLNTWLGMSHKLSLVDRHESNGVEQTNRSILKHLTALVVSERASTFWDEPEYMATVKHIINSTADFECGLSPHELTFGSIEMLYLGLPEILVDPSVHHEYLRNLNNYLIVARQESELYHRSVIEARAAHGPSVDLQSYSSGDLVLFVPNARSKIHKLMPQLLGPYRVVSQINAEVTCRQVATGVIKIFHNSRLVLYTGPDDQTAFDLACRDDDQYRVKAILG